MIRIVTDTAADLTAEEAALPGISVVPMSILFADGTVVRDGIDITKDEYFARLAQEEKLPQTSQPSPECYIQELEAAKKAGDEVIIITISAKLSGTYQGAVFAAADYSDLAYVVDSGTATQGEALLVREAIRLRDEEHLPAAEIVAQLEALKGRIYVLAVVDSLKHLQKGGRLPAAVAVVGGALGIKPVIRVHNGGIKLADKARGRAGALVALLRQLEKLGGLDKRYGCTLLYSDQESVALPLERLLQANLPVKSYPHVQIGATIGTHIGGNATGIVFVAKEAAE